MSPPRTGRLLTEVPSDFFAFASPIRIAFSKLDFSVAHCVLQWAICVASKSHSQHNRSAFALLISFISKTTRTHLLSHLSFCPTARRILGLVLEHSNLQSDTHTISSVVR